MAHRRSNRDPLHLIQSNLIARVAPSTAGPAPTVSAAAPKLDLPTPVEELRASAKRLKPWIDVALPHPDVLANRFKEAEFAADLFAVDAGHATEDYGSAENFFRITFLTEGLRRVLTSSLQRLAGKGGDPVIGLQTSFGGGKTHTMLALFHLASAKNPKTLPGLADIFEEAGVAALTIAPTRSCSSARRPARINQSRSKAR